MEWKPIVLAVALGVATNLITPWVRDRARRLVSGAQSVTATAKSVIGRSWTSTRTLLEVEALTRISAIQTDQMYLTRHCTHAVISTFLSVTFWLCGVFLDAHIAARFAFSCASGLFLGDALTYNYELYLTARSERARKAQKRLLARIRRRLERLGATETELSQIESGAAAEVQRVTGEVSLRENEGDAQREAVPPVKK